MTHHVLFAALDFTTVIVNGTLAGGSIKRGHYTVAAFGISVAFLLLALGTVEALIALQGCPP